MKPIARFFTAAAAIALLPHTANAQDTGASPTYETVNLEAGFPNDPYSVTLSSGGSIDASNISDDCAGFIANAPDVRLVYKAGSLPLYLSAASDADTTLVVNAPDGQWFCDDDGNGGLDPLVWFDTPQSGQYDIWVGTYADSNVHSATLNISELASGGAGDEGNFVDESISTGIDYGAEPSYETVSLNAGFTPDPYTVSLSSGGDNDASQLGTPCTGFVANVPDVRLNYEAGSLPLYFRTRADEDTTLAVNAPDGQWYCDDDSGGGLNAQVWFDAPQSGQYDVFVGSYGSSDLHDTTLQISELAAGKR